jgi:DNA-directed RNA polymerase specialized sigma24 family protein
MAKTRREQRREQFLAMLNEHELKPAEVADLLHVSIDAVKAWMKPETSKSSNPVPPWATELLGYKLNDKKVKR